MVNDWLFGFSQVLAAFLAAWIIIDGYPRRWWRRLVRWIKGG